MNAKTAIVLVAGLLIGIGCGGKKTTAGAKAGLNKNLKLPEFVLNPPVADAKAREGYLFGSGQCEVLKTESTAELAIKAADTRARQDIQEQLKNKIASKVESYLARAGATKSESDDATKTAVLSIGSMDLSGAEIIKREYIDGIIYSQARYPLDPEKRDLLANSISKQVYGSDALRSKSAAEKEMAELKAEIDSEMSSMSNGK